MSDSRPHARPAGPFDTDASALARRIEAHARFGTRDLDPWLLEKLELTRGLRVLELGCGTGKQTLPIASAIGAEGSVLAVDASGDAISALRAAASEQGVLGRLTLREADFDELGDVGSDLDRAVSSYALYYARKPERLFDLISEALADHGLFVFCGPSARNNAELLSFVAALTGNEEADKPADYVVEFMEHTGPALTRARFAQVEELEFENALRFDSPDALLEYWRSYNLYDASLEPAFRSAATNHFASAPIFETVKRVRTIKASAVRR